MPGIVQAAMDKVAAVSGRQYHLFDYVGHPEVGGWVHTSLSDGAYVLRFGASLPSDAVCLPVCLSAVALFGLPHVCKLRCRTLSLCLQAEYVTVAMGSGCEVLELAVKNLVAEGKKVGLVKVRASAQRGRKL